MTQQEGMNLRIGPELIGAWFSKRRLTAPLTTAPAEVSEWFAAGLVRFDFYNEGSASRMRDQVLNRMGVSFGGGLAFGRFREGNLLIDGTTNADRQSDTVVGPVVNVGLGYWIARDWILRGDGYVIFSKPELSLLWNRYPTFVGIGVVKTF